MKPTFTIRPGAAELALSAVLVLGGPGIMEAASEEQPDLPRIRPALCSVLVDGHLAASGFFVSDSGTCLTCAHALLGRQEVELLLADGRRLDAKRAAVSEAEDTALLQAELPEGGKVAFIPLARDLPPLGGRIFLAGTPVYRHCLFLSGSVASRRPCFEYNAELKTYVDVIYASAMTPRGTSGGPWLSGSGEVIGLQSGGMAKGDTFWGVAFVVPVGSLRRLVAEPERDVARGDLGAAVEELWEQPAAMVSRFAPQSEAGLVLKQVLRGGAVDRASLREGDLVVAVDGTTCRYRRELLDLVRAKKPGDLVRLEVVRVSDGQLSRTAVPVRLGSTAEAARYERR